MLEQLLQMIRDEGGVYITLFARRLNTTPALVEQMLAHLERTGYLEAVQTCQTSHCHGCRAASLCNQKSPRAWTTGKNT